MKTDPDKTPKRDPNTGRFAGKKKDKANANTHGLGMGVNATEEHQMLIRNVIYYLTGLFFDDRLAYEPFPETSYLREQGGPAPDISLYDRENATHPLIIEFTTRNAYQEDIKKCRLAMQKLYGIKEAVIYEFQKGDWTRLRILKGKIVQEEGESFSTVIGLDIAKMLKGKH